VLLLMLDSNDWPVSFLGAMYAGLVPVAVNTLLTADDYAYMLEHSRAQAVLVSGALLPALTAGHGQVRPRGAEGGRVAPGGAAAPGRSRVRELPGRASAGAQAGGHQRRRPGLLAVFVGSTGRPKGTVHSHANPYWTCELYGKAVLQLRETTSASPPPSCSSPTAWAMR
jgi:benzoate-CoA ligase